MEARLQESPYLAGDKYTIADIASFEWVRVAPMLLEWDLSEWPALKKWHDTIIQREAVQKGYTVPPRTIPDEQFMAFLKSKKAEIMAKGNSDVQ